MGTIENYWHRIDDELKRVGSSISLMASETGIDYPTIRQWRTHNRIPNPDALIKISHFLNVSIDYLLTGIVIKESHPEDLEVDAVKTNPSVRLIVNRCINDPEYLKTVSYIANQTFRTT